MAHYSALVSGFSMGSAFIQDAATEGIAPSQMYGSAASMTQRIPRILQPHTQVEDPGGFIAADFIVPPEEAVRFLPILRTDMYVWLFDGRTPIFYGKIPSQPKPDDSGALLVAVDGWWSSLHETRMREVWEDPDVGAWIPCEGNDHLPSVDVTSSGKLRIGWKEGTVLANGNRAQLDYLLFNEPTGSRDTKKITAFEINCTDDLALGDAKIAFRVYGRPDTAMGAGAEDQLRGITGAAGSFNAKEGAIADAWVSSSGYRCIRMGLQAISAGTMGADRHLLFDRLRIATRESFLTTFGSPPDSSDIAADVFHEKGAAQSAWLDLPPVFWRSGLPSYGRDAVNGFVEPSGVGSDGINFLAWSSPAEALAALSTIDGFKSGFYFPAAPCSGWWAPTLVPWMQQPPSLLYEPWAPLSSPEYLISSRKGALVEPDDSPQPLVSALYVTYQHSNGRPFSLYVEDNDSSNYLFAQGIRRAEDYEIEPPVSDATAANLARQVFTLRRQPMAAGKVTIYADRRGSIVDGAGAIIPKLSQLRPGVASIVDLPRTGFKTGRITKVEWWGETSGSPERAELTLEHPGKVNLPRRLGSIAVLAQRTVRSRGGGPRRRR